MFNIYAAAVKTKPLDIKNNFAQAVSEVEKAKYLRAKLVIFPQGFLTGVQVGILSDALYFTSIYNKMVQDISLKFPEMYILADIHTRNGFVNKLFHNGEKLDAEHFEIDGYRFVAYSDMNKLRDEARDIYADCILINESKPVVAGSRHLTKKLLEAIQMGTGANIVANFGGYGFTSHPYIYMPALAFICRNRELFTGTVNQYVTAEKFISIEKAVQGNRNLYNLPILDFDIVFKQNPFIPEQIDEREYCLDLFQLQALSLANRLDNINCKKAVVAVSGGLDSALALLVTVSAFDFLGIDRKNIKCISMPGFGTSSTTKNLAKELCNSL